MGVEEKRLVALVVDDYEKIRKRLTAALEQRGMAVTEAVDGLDALEKLRGGSFDLLFTDIVMPRMDGFELCQAVRMSPEHREMAIIAVSTHYDTSYLVKALRLGADDYLPKPVQGELLDRVIERVTARFPEELES
jgi:two-component system, chemotaxis family, chemotaxis protein CheY